MELTENQKINTKNYIYIKGARVHNLKNIDVEIERNKLTIITGLSGSGKSSLAFDTLFAEGQRRYVESLSAYARQFLGKIEKPDVDHIVGISPAIAIEQKVNTVNKRSTVGTSTEIYDYLKLLFARIGKTYSPISGNPVKREQVNDVFTWIMLPEFELYELVERLTPEVLRVFKGEKFTKVVCINVDFYSGFVYACLDIPKELYTPLFAVARVSGWCTHRIEELTFSAKRIIRPAFKNVFPKQSYVPLSERKNQEL